MITFWNSPGKINLFLHVLKKRQDGYHNIKTLFQLINYCDVIKIESNSTHKIKLITTFTNIKNKKNLILKAAFSLMKEAIKTKKNFFGVNISVKKKLPIGGGLGGGSSNAATILIALNYLWNLNFSLKKLEKIGLKLGSDIPFFIKGYSGFAEGRGEKIYPIKIPTKWYLIIYPQIQISTKLMFQKISSILREKKFNLSSSDIYVQNIFEYLVRKNFYQVDETMKWLSKYSKSKITGTGSCVFSQFEKKSQALNILKKVPIWLKVFVAKGINTSPLHLDIKKLILKNLN